MPTMKNNYTGASETESATGPEWLKELEEKRERRLKARLGHEAGAGSPCLQCKSACPGLDLHFWRKICKICKCGKENHDVQDDDIHGWAQFQLLGSKPKKPQKYVIPGKKDEIELEWTPKGSKEAIEQYLQHLPPDKLPIKGSSAAQERKQLLQKQIPVHDIDPALCHSLTEEELKKMNDYINHLKQNSVGIGQMVHLSSKKAEIGNLVSDKITEQTTKVERKHISKSNISRSLRNTQNLNKNLQNQTRTQLNYKNNQNCFIPIKEDDNQIYANLDQLSIDTNVLPHYIPGKYHTFQENRNPTAINPLKDVVAQMFENIKPTSKHDYENVDKFGKHKLEASLEELENRQTQNKADMQDIRSNHVLDSHGNPIHAKYAMLLDHGGLPLKDKFGSPIRVNLDIYKRPILDEAIVEKIGSAVKADYAILLDKNGAPLLDKYGNSIKNTIEYGLPLPLDKFGNEIKPQFALLLDKTGNIIKDIEGSPIKVSLDATNRPILGDIIIEKIPPLEDPHYSMPLDRNGAPILDKYGTPVRNFIDYGIPRGCELILDKFSSQLEPYYALLLDENGSPMKDKQGSPIRAKLDESKNPIYDKASFENLHKRPEFALLFDKNGAPIVDKHGTPIKQNLNQQSIGIDKFGKDIQPAHALLLDTAGIPLKDRHGSPIKASVDCFGHPIFTGNVIKQLGIKVPEYALLLDKLGMPILDKYGNTIQNKINGYKYLPESAIVLDKADNPVLDKFGVPIEFKLDKYLMPIINDGFVLPVQPRYALLLDSNKKPLKDKLNKHIKINLDQKSSDLLVDKQTVPINVDSATFLDITGRPLLDAYGTPLEIKLDRYGRPILQNVTQPVVDKSGKSIDLDKATLLGKNGLPILDSRGNPVRLRTDNTGVITVHDTGIPLLDKTGTSILHDAKAFADSPFLRPVVDKYGNHLDPNTGRLIPQSELHRYYPVNTQQGESIQNPVMVNIGAIKDLEYENYPTTIIGEEMLQEEDNFIPPPDDDPLYQLPECHKCKKIFEENAVVIEIERTDHLWHSSCFKCAGCNQNLADLLYFYHKDTDDIYCGRDFAKIRGIPRCHACDELIFQEYCLAEGMTYHLKHFCCFECDEPLAGQNYLIENEQPICIGCYEKLKANKCNTCEKIIGPSEEGVNLNETHFHANDACFCCKSCKKPLLGSKFLFRNKVLFCSSACYNKETSC